MIEKQEAGWYLTGNITLANVVKARAQGLKIILENKIDCLDLSAVASNDSSILALLLAWKREAKKKAIRLEYVNFSSSLASIIRLCNLKNIL